MPFGTRVMIVQDPKPQNAFLSRSYPVTVFSLGSSITNGMWTYQNDSVKCRANVAVRGLDVEDLNWVMVHVGHRGPPDSLLPTLTRRRATLPV